MKELILDLPTGACLTFTTDDKIDFTTINMCCDNMKVFLNQELSLRIGQETAGEVLEQFLKKLIQAYNNQLPLDSSITQNLGWMNNEYMHEYPKNKFNFQLTPQTMTQVSYWVGLQYQVWSTFDDANPYVSTWLYNDIDNNIIFEVTPFYRWSIQAQKPEDIDFISYAEFMQNYTPLFYAVIPHHVAAEWLKKTTEAYRLFFSTEENFQKACHRLYYS